MVGKRGLGKTTLIKNLLVASEPVSRVVALDFLGEYKAVGDCVVYSGLNSVAKAVNLIWSGRIEGKRIFIVDELDMYSGREIKILRSLFRLSRHKNIEILASSHRLYSLDVVFRALIDEFYFFRISEVRDLDYIASVWGREISDKIKALKRFEYIKLEA